MVDDLFSSGWLWAGLGLLGAVAVGGGAYYRYRSKNKSGTETSFLESRLQPDSFFGASGGQRVDTKEAASSGGPSSASSSMSYSLSQLDAIGDVDPVAEADVYLAYGRDLQAEEILKEALRTTPDRVAIRSKLLEVYAKRRDAKGFESLAAQLYGQTSGQGDEWAKAQELGAQIDPENPMYKPGGKPAGDGGGASGKATYAGGATTQPQSTVAMTAFPATEAATRAMSRDSKLDFDVVSGRVDLDAPPMPKASPVSARDVFDKMPSLDMPDVKSAAKSAVSSASGAAAGAVGSVAAAATGAAAAATGLAAATVGKVGSAAPSVTSSLGLPSGDAMAASTTMAMEFDMGDFGAGTSPAAKSASGPVTTSGADAMFARSESGSPELKLSTNFGAIEADPLVRKIELAEEFRQIGDIDGARDLLEEVVAKASGDLKSRAQTMLARLG
jgi:pilus assembly protein FimV